MTTTTLIARLLELPAEIESAERQVHMAHIALTHEKWLLAEEEAHLLTADPPRVTGSNEAQRKASLCLLTQDRQRAIRRADDEVRLAVIALQGLQNEFSAVRSVARLLARETE